MNNDQLIRAVALIATELHIQNELVIAKTPRNCLSGVSMQKLLECFEGYIANSDILPGTMVSRKEVDEFTGKERIVMDLPFKSLIETLLEEDQYQVAP